MKKPIIIAISLYISLALIIGLVLPRYRELRVVKKEIEEANAKIEKRDKYFSQLRELADQLKKYQEEISKIDSAIPSEMSVLNMFNFLSETSSQNGLLLKEVALEKSSSSKISSRLRENYITFNVVGSYPSFKNFLSLLEKSARIIQIENISFSSGSVSTKKGEAPTLFKVTIKVNSY